MQFFSLWTVVSIPLILLIWLFLCFLFRFNFFFLKRKNYLVLICLSDYSGDSCNLIEDSCSNNPCNGNGICSLQNVGYTCTCDGILLFMYFRYQAIWKLPIRRTDMFLQYENEDKNCTISIPNGNSYCRCKSSARALGPKYYQQKLTL